MSGNDYEGVFEKQEIELIRQWAKQARFQSEDIPDVLQEVAMVVIQRPEGYRCANNHPPDDHPVLRWRESDLESAIVEHLDSFRFPSEETAAWFRETLEAAFADQERIERHRRRTLKKRRTELANMQDRLLNTHLVGAIDEATFSAKSTDLKHQQADVERQFSEIPRLDLNQAETALDAFDFSQNLVKIWRGSNSAARRELLDCVSLNRTLSDVSLYLAKRKPFDIFAERPFLKNSRGDWI